MHRVHHKVADYTKKEPRHPSNKELYAKLVSLRQAGIARGGMGPAGGLYGTALSALEKYPLPVLGASQAEEILGFGPKVAQTAQQIADNKYKKYFDFSRQQKRAEAVARDLEEKEMEAKRNAQIKKETVRVKVLDPQTGLETEMGYRKILPGEPKLYTRESCILAALYKTGEVQVGKKCLEQAAEGLWREEIGGKELRFKGAAAELINRGFLEVFDGEQEEEFSPSPEGAAVGKYHSYLYDGGLQQAGQHIPPEYLFNKRREDSSSEQSIPPPVQRPVEEAPKKETISSKVKDLFAGRAKQGELKSVKAASSTTTAGQVAAGPEDIEDEEPPIDKLNNQTKPPTQPWSFKLKYNKILYPAELQIDPNDLLPINPASPQPSGAQILAETAKCSSSEVFLAAGRPDAKVTSLNTKKPMFHSFYESFAPSGQNAASRWEPLLIPREKVQRVEILLLIDIREKKSNQSEQKSGYFKDKLQQFDINCETASLPVGDFLWILEVEDVDGNKFRGPLDLIVERKYVTDLAASLADGRYEEQKARLKMSGIKQVAYIIEGDVRPSKADNLALITAMSSVKVFNKFSLVKTPDVDGTVKVLASMHRSIIENWNRLEQQDGQQETLRLMCDLEQFSKGIKRSDVLSPAAVFLQSLRHIKGLGSLSVNAIEQSARCFRDMYDYCNGQGSEHRLAMLQSRLGGKAIFRQLEAVFVKRKGWAASK